MPCLNSTRGRYFRLARWLKDPAKVMSGLGRAEGEGVTRHKTGCWIGAAGHTNHAERALRKTCRNNPKKLWQKALAFGEPTETVASIDSKIFNINVGRKSLVILSPPNSPNNSNKGGHSCQISR